MPGNPIKSIAYVSRAVAEFDETALRNLAEHAAEKNQRLGLTGYLFYLAPYFVQYLEGPDSALREVMETIASDPRHHIVRTLPLAMTTKRLFPDWSMRTSGADHRQLPGWSTRDQGPADVSLVRLERVLQSLLLHTPVDKLRSDSVINMVGKLFADLAERERCALAQL